MKIQKDRVLLSSISLMSLVAAVVMIGAMRDRGLPGRASARGRSPIGGSLRRDLPPAFEANRGQADARVRFLARGAGGTLYLTDDESILVLHGARAGGESGTDRAGVARMRLLGENPAPKVVALDELPGRSNYFTGGDPRRWHAAVPRYGRVRYEDVYPGVDLVYRGRAGRFEYDLVVAPGADVDRIRIGLEGSGPARIDARGDIVLPVGEGEVVQHAPRAYQVTGDDLRLVPVRYRLRGRDAVGLDVDRDLYDPARPLVIDPVLSFSTFFGGGYGETAQAVAVDGAGEIVVAGFTQSVDFPVAHAYQPNHKGSVTAPREETYISKFTPDGSALVYSTYLGGTDDDLAYGVAVDRDGSAYVTGLTLSTDFPVVNAYQPALRTGTTGADAFVSKLSPDGATLVYSTYLGGTSGELAFGIAVDDAGSATVVGQTYSRDFPVGNAVQPAAAGAEDAFITRLSPAGNSLVFSTYLGGTFDDVASGVAVDPAGNVYVAGRAYGPGFPLVHPLRVAPPPSGTGQVSQQGFVAKLDPTGRSILYSTFLGDALAYAVAADAAGNAYIAGGAANVYGPGGPDVPLRNPIQPFLAGSANVMVTKIDPAGSAFVYSTLLGGGGSDWASAIAVDSSGQAYVTGSARSADFPSVRSIQSGPAPGREPDAFLAKLGPGGDVLVYSTCLGGGRWDDGRGIAVDGAGNAVLVGATSSADFPTARPFQAAMNGTGDAFVAEIADDAPAPEPPPLPASGRVEESDAAVHRMGNWYTSGSSAHSDGSAIFSADSAARLVFTFRGTGVRWIGMQDEWSGIARVSLDGVPAGTIDTYASPSREQAAVSTIGGLADEPHTLVIEVTGTRGSASAGPWIWIDAFDVTGSGPGPTPTPTPTPEPTPTPTPATGRVEEGDSAVSTSGTWYANDQDRHSGGTAILTMETGSRATLTFDGTGVTWIGYRDEWSGIADVYLDGVFARTVDTFASPARYQDPLFSITGLAPGMHTLAIEATGTFGPASAAGWIWVDAFDVMN